MSKLKPFALERYFARHEFQAPYLMCGSDSESLSLQELLQFADDECLHLWHSMSLGYTESQGLLPLRTAIAHHFYSCSSLSPHDIVIAAPQEILALTMQAILQPGDTIIVQYPGYQSLYEVAVSIGCTVIYWELEEFTTLHESRAKNQDKNSTTTNTSRNNSFKFDVSKLVGLTQQHPETKMVVVNFPHNPTGFLPTQQEWQSIIDACRSIGTLLFSDEMYRTLELHPEEDRLPAAVDVYPEGAISLGGLSKSVGLAGVRVGWIACHTDTDNKDNKNMNKKKIIERVLELKDYGSICTAAPSEVLALIGVRNWDKILKRQLAIIQTNLAALEEFLKRWKDVIVLDYVPKTGTICFPRIVATSNSNRSSSSNRNSSSNNEEGGVDIGEDIHSWCERCVEECGVLLLPATVYDYEPSIQAGRVRIGYGRKNFIECLGHFDEWLKKEAKKENKHL